MPAPASALRAAGVALALAALAPAAASASTPDEQARFLSGLPVPAGSALAALEETGAWKDHARGIGAAWAKLERRLAAMDGWASAELWPRVDPRAPLLYLFGGPDAINAVRLFPDAPAYLLAGLEPVGQLPPPEGLSPAALRRALDGLSESIRTVVPASFFRTHEMGNDLSGDAIDGVQPLVYLFLARSGARVLSAQRIEIDDAGVARAKPDGEPWGAGTRGIEIRFQREGRPAQTLTYVKVDLHDDALGRKPGFLAFARALGPANALLKAASFILHDRHFSRAKALLLEQSRAVLQDDSGLPFRAFEADAWDFVAFGRYLPPKPPFQRAHQPELAKLFLAGPARSVPFVFGYRRGAAETNLLLAVRRGAPAASAPRPASPQGG